jgi:hypothetical protein
VTVVKRRAVMEAGLGSAALARNRAALRR